MLGKIVASSKFGLKKQCLYISGFDVQNAEKLYDFLVKDMEELPAIEPPEVSTFDTVKTTAGGIFNWLKDNKDDLMQAADFIRSLRKGAPIQSGNPLPPING